MTLRLFFYPRLNQSIWLPSPLNSPTINSYERVLTSTLLWNLEGSRKRWSSRSEEQSHKIPTSLAYFQEARERIGVHGSGIWYPGCSKHLRHAVSLQTFPCPQQHRSKWQRWLRGGVPSNRLSEPLDWITSRLDHLVSWACECTWIIEFEILESPSWCRASKVRNHPRTIEPAHII